MNFDLNNTNIVLIAISAFMLFGTPIIVYIFNKKTIVNKQNKELEEIKKEYHIQKKRNETLRKELQDNLDKSDELIDAIKVETEKVQIMENYEHYRKRKHRETYFIQSYVGLDEEKAQETTDIVSAQIFTKNKTTELSEKEKIALIDDSPETENKHDESDSYNKLHQETLEMKKRLDDSLLNVNKKSYENEALNGYKPKKEGDV